MTACRSFNTTIDGDRIPSLDCTRELGHEGECRDSKGHHWTRLSELLRQDGLELFGYLVRRIG